MICNHKNRHKFLAIDKKTGTETIMFEGILEIEYDSKKKHSFITCPYGYTNKVHQFLDGTEIVFQWYETNKENQTTECSGPNWDKLQNNCFGRLVSK